LEAGESALPQNHLNRQGGAHRDAAAWIPRLNGAGTPQRGVPILDLIAYLFHPPFGRRCHPVRFGTTGHDRARLAFSNCHWTMRWWQPVLGGADFPENRWRPPPVGAMEQKAVQFFANFFRQPGDFSRASSHNSLSFPLLGGI